MTGLYLCEFRRVIYEAFLSRNLNHKMSVIDLSRSLVDTNQLAWTIPSDVGSMVALVTVHLGRSALGILVLL